MSDIGIVRRRRYISQPESFFSAPAATVGSSYTGPGDIAPGAIGAWMLRAYSAATIGTNCVRLRKSSGGELDFVTLSDGSLDMPSINTWRGADQVFLRTVYDQTGIVGDAVQATTGSQLELIPSGLGSLPVLRENGGTKSAVTPSITRAQPFTVSTVAKYDGIAGRYAVFGDAGATIYGGRRGGGVIFNAASEISVTVANGWHTAQSVFNGASSDLYVDGATNPSNPGTAGFGSALILGSDGSGAIWISDFAEVIMWPSDIGASKSPVNANQRAYWGI